MNKKIFSIFFLISLILHCLLIFAFSKKRPMVKNNDIEIDWKIIPASPGVETKPVAALQKIPETKIPAITAPTQTTNKQIPEKSIIVKPIETVSPDSINQGPSFDPFWNTPLAMSKQDIDLDSLERPQTLSFGKKLPPLFSTVSPGSGGDRIDNDIYKRNTGHQGTVPVGSLLLKGAQMLKKKLFKEKKPELNFIPTLLQLSAFNTVWEKSQATDQDIYANLDSSVVTTSEELNGELSRLEKQGFLTRKIVSPRNELTLMTPIGAKAVEMSPTNRRNRIFEYKPKIEKEQVLRFLNAALYQVEHGIQRDFFSTQDSLSLVKDLKRKILLLSQENNPH